MDELRFLFTGGLADRNRMDFYESSRFQYAAARLTVKLDQFRRTGRFTKKVTRLNNTDIDLLTFQAGSFDIRIEAGAQKDDQCYLNVPLTTLWTYVVERIFQPADTVAALDLIDTASLRNEFNDLIDDHSYDASQAIDLIRKQLDTFEGVTANESQLLERLISEVGRRAYLESHRDLLQKISPDEDAALMTMATPLMREIAVPMRRSANRVTIQTIDRFGNRPILSADRKMAEEIESINIDKEVTQIDVNIVQFNKENGWGKFRNPNWAATPSFSIPADRKPELKYKMMQAMKEEKVSIRAYIVRSASGQPIRLIVVGVDLVDEIENRF